MQPIRHALALAILLAAGTYADIAPSPMYSKGIAALQKTQVQMVDELVTIDLYKDYALVTAEFNMKNHGGDTTLEIGFPNTEGNFGTMLTNFAIRVDGRERPYEVRDDEALIKHLENEPVWWEESPWIIRQWLLWNETFGQDENKRIIVSYRQPAWYMSRDRIHFNCYFIYLLETGAGWKDNIGRATVILNLKDGLTADHMLKLPEGYSQSSNRYEWVFENLEPTSTNNFIVHYNRFKDYPEFLASSKAEDAVDWVDAWTYAYAFNKVGDHEAALKTLAAHAKQPKDSSIDTGFYGGKFPLNIAETEPRKIAGLEDEFEAAVGDEKYKQLALHKQVVMARYQLYLRSKDKTAEQELQTALRDLKIWARFKAENPDTFDSLIPSRNFTAPSHQWLLSEYIMDDYTIGSRRSGLRAFRTRWNEKIEAVIEGKNHVLLVNQNVYIELYKDHRSVTAEYQLRNTGPETTVRVELEELAGDYLLSDLFDDFQLYINDTAIPAGSAPIPPTDGALNRSKWNPEWKLDFEEAEEKKVRISYNVPYDKEWVVGNQPEQRHYQYLYDRCAGWHGTIGQSTITIDLKDFTTDALVHIDPSPTKTTKNRLVWEFEDWEPDSTGRVKLDYTCFTASGE